MTLYYYNRLGGADSIDAFFNNIQGIRRITNNDCTNTLNFQAGDLVFVHPGDNETGPGKEWWVNRATENEQADFVFMSTQPARIGGEATDPLNVHFCEYAADRLSEHPRISEFFSLLAKGEKRWELLKSLPFPEYLLAAYLVQAAAKNGVSVNPEESGCTDFWNKAREEFDQRTTQESELPEFTPNGDPSKLKLFLESIARGS